MKKAKPASQAELDALVQRHLATHEVTHCAPHPADGVE
jgi:hypothetical protein